jgi:ribA/ribD-fused uncharacterized protein
LYVGTVDVIVFNLIFNDVFTFEKIMLEKSPSKQKKIGRQVKNFDSKYWDKICIHIITNGVTEKFRQNKHLLNELLSTGNKKFVLAKVRAMFEVFCKISAV